MMNVNSMGVAELRLAVQELRRYPAEVERLTEELECCKRTLAARNKAIQALHEGKDTRVPATAEVKRLRNMMTALIDAPCDSPEWSHAMDSIGWYITEQKGGE